MKACVFPPGRACLTFRDVKLATWHNDVNALFRRAHTVKSVLKICRRTALASSLLLIQMVLKFVYSFISIFQGRNPSGVAGLFPKSYTTDEAPTSSTLSFPAPTISSSSSSAEASIASQPPAITLTSVAEEPEIPHANGSDDRERTLSEGEQVMKATISDVQKAIEQLGRNDRDGAQSFSFASSHGDYTDRSETETEAESDDDGQGWHKDAREKLAARAKQENEERRAKEAAEQSAQSIPLRSLAPPIEVEMSDESEGEDEDGHVRRSQRHSDPYFRHHSLIPEEEEDIKPETVKRGGLPLEATQDLIATPALPSDTGSASIIPSEEFIVPHVEHDDADVPTASAHQTTFPIASVDPPSSPDPEVPIAIPSTEATPTMTAAQVDITPHPIVTSLPTSPQIPPPPAEPQLVVAPVVMPVPVVTPAPVLRSEPSQTRVADQSSYPVPYPIPIAMPSPSASSFSSSVAPSTFAVAQSVTPATTVTSFKTANFASPSSSEQRNSTPNDSKSPSNPPLEWSVEDVVDWLRAKGFDEGVCSLFIGT